MTTLWIEPSLDPPEDHNWERFCDRIDDQRLMFDDISGLLELLIEDNMLPPMVNIVEFDCHDTVINSYSSYYQMIEVVYTTHYQYTCKHTGETTPVICYADIRYNLSGAWDKSYSYDADWEFGHD